jgi:hypothetical protein
MSWKCSFGFADPEKLGGGIIRMQVIWSPTQWAWEVDGADDDIDHAPSLPEWKAVIDMIMRSLSLQNGAPCLTLDDDDGRQQDLSFDRHLSSILTIAYGCLRGLTVQETLQLFGKAGAGYCAYGHIHPVRTLDNLTRVYRHGSDLMSKYVSFPDGVNPLMERTA